MEAVSKRKRHALALFEPLGPTYDRYASILSFGQDPRWRRFLVRRVEGERILDVACGTGAVSEELELLGYDVVGLDQSEAMLTVARARVPHATFVVGEAEHLPFADGAFDGLTVTYLLRYVDDPAATVRELARVVEPGGVVAMLEFGVPRGVWRPLWELWVRIGLPGAGRVISPGWHEVGAFLGGSIRDFHARYDIATLFREAGLSDVRERRLSVGGGLVVWGRV